MCAPDRDCGQHTSTFRQPQATLRRIPQRDTTGTVARDRRERLTISTGASARRIYQHPMRTPTFRMARAIDIFHHTPMAWMRIRRCRRWYAIHNRAYPYPLTLQLAHQQNLLRLTIPRPSVRLV